MLLVLTRYRCDDFLIPHPPPRNLVAVESVAREYRLLTSSVHSRRRWRRWRHISSLGWHLEDDKTALHMTCVAWEPVEPQPLGMTVSPVMANGGRRDDRTSCQTGYGPGDTSDGHRATREEGNSEGQEKATTKERSWSLPGTDWGRTLAYR